MAYLKHHYDQLCKDLEERLENLGFGELGDVQQWTKHALLLTFMWELILCSFKKKKRIIWSQIS